MQAPPEGPYKVSPVTTRRAGNWGIALSLFSFAAGAYIYSMYSVKRKDEFANVDEKGNIVGAGGPRPKQ